MTRHFSPKNLLSVALPFFGSLLLLGCASSGRVTPDPAEPPRSAATPGFDSTKINRIAVIAVAPEIVAGVPDEKDTPSRIAIEDEFNRVLLEKGYELAARSDVNHLLKEIGFQNSGLTEAGAAKLGRMMNVSAVLVVRIVSQSAARWASWNADQLITGSLGARLIDANKDKLLWTSTLRGSKVVRAPGFYQDPELTLLYAAREKMFAGIAREMAATFPSAR